MDMQLEEIKENQSDTWNEDQKKMRSGRLCREGEGSKVEMVWTCNKR